ncbi:MAG: hypothetical protein F4X72_02140 [Dehalococcoidia bacterium]|nr:hypothetical protein [Dehalococcoidia bacterium]
MEKYLYGLQKKCPKADIAITYLTPFNKDRAKAMKSAEVAQSLPTVREFRQFTESCSSARARHVSWLDLAEVPIVENALWEQHREYVREHISSDSLLDESRGRTLERFFGQRPTLQFREALRSLDIKVDDPGIDINFELERYEDDLQAFAGKLVKALEILVCDGDGVSREPKSTKRNAFDNPGGFKSFPYSKVHSALFDLADRYDCLWLEGKQDYAVRVAHDRYKSSGVSLIRSVGTSALLIKGRR